MRPSSKVALLHFPRKEAKVLGFLNNFCLKKNINKNSFPISFVPKICCQTCFRGFSKILGDFRLEYEYEIENEYDFSNRERILKIITWHTNVAPKAFTSTDQQQGEAMALGT